MATKPHTDPFLAVKDKTQKQAYATVRQFVGTVVENETVAGSGQSWTLAQFPVNNNSIQLFVRTGAHNGALLFQGQGLDYTIQGRAITTATSFSAGQLRCWYRSQ